MLIEQQIYLFGQIQTSLTGGQLYSDILLWNNLVLIRLGYSSSPSKT